MDVLTQNDFPAAGTRTAGNLHSINLRGVDLCRREALCEESGEVEEMPSN